MRTQTKVGRASRKQPHREDDHFEESTARGGQKASEALIAKHGVRRNPHFIEQPKRGASKGKGQA